jgi:regulator of RNase E activity RraA
LRNVLGLGHMSQSASLDTIKTFQVFGTLTICDTKNRRGMSHRIKPIWKRANKVLLAAHEGDLPAASAGDWELRVPVGRKSCLQLLKREAYGPVISGAVKDSQAVERIRFPIFAVGFSSHGSTKASLGPINVPSEIYHCAETGSVKLIPNGGSDGRLVRRWQK